MNFKTKLRAFGVAPKSLIKVMVTTTALLLGSGVAISSAHAAGDLTRLKIQSYPGLVTAGQSVLWVAVEKGFCKDHGLDCQLVEIASGPLGLQALVSDSIQIGMATTDTAMQAAARGSDIQLIASIHPNRYFTLSVRKDIPMPNISKGYPSVMQDFKGLKVGVTGRGSGTEIQTRALLAGAGLRPSDVTFVAVGSSGTSYPAMLAKQIDAVMGFEPFATLCELQDTCINVIMPNEGPNELKALDGAVEELSASRAFIKENPETIDAFIRAIEDSVAWARNPENIDELVAVAKRYFTLGDIPNSDGALKMLLQKEQKQLGATLDRKAVQAHADFLLKNGLIDKPFDVTGFVYEKAPTP